MNENPNVSVGFTSDGLIFLLINSVHKGEPTQTQVMMNTDGALSVADAIKQAVEGIRSKKHGGNGTNTY